MGIAALLNKCSTEFYERNRTDIELIVAKRDKLAYLLENASETQFLEQLEPIMRTFVLESKEVRKDTKMKLTAIAGGAAAVTLQTAEVCGYSILYSANSEKVASFDNHVNGRLQFTKAFVDLAAGLASGTWDFEAQTGPHIVLAKALLDACVATPSALIHFPNFASYINDARVALVSCAQAAIGGALTPLAPFIQVFLQHKLDEPFRDADHWKLLPNSEESKKAMADPCRVMSCLALNYAQLWKHFPEGVKLPTDSETPGALFDVAYLVSLLIPGLHGFIQSVMSARAAHNLEAEKIASGEEHQKLMITPGKAVIDNLAILNNAYLAVSTGCEMLKAQLMTMGTVGDTDLMKLEDMIGKVHSRMVRLLCEAVEAGVDSLTECADKLTAGALTLEMTKNMEFFDGTAMPENSPVLFNWATCPDAKTFYSVHKQFAQRVAFIDGHAFTLAMNTAEFEPASKVLTNHKIAEHVKANKTWKINAICLTLVQALYRPLNPGETRSSIATRCQVLLPHGVPKGLEKLVVEFSGTTTMALAESKKKVQTGSMCFVVRVGWR